MRRIGYILCILFTFISAFIVMTVIGDWIAHINGMYATGIKAEQELENGNY
jgi:hypothetical protein